MHELSDEELDRLGRDAAEHYPAERGDLSWERMEGLLDRDMPGDRKKRRPFWWFLLAGVAIIGTAAFFGLRDNDMPKRPEAAATPVLRSAAADRPEALALLDTTNAASPAIVPESTTNTPVFVDIDQSPDEVQLVVSFDPGTGVAGDENSTAPDSATRYLAETTASTGDPSSDPTPTTPIDPRSAPDSGEVTNAVARQHRNNNTAPDSARQSLRTSGTGETGDALAIDPENALAVDDEKASPMVRASMATATSRDRSKDLFIAAPLPQRQHPALSSNSPKTRQSLAPTRFQLGILGGPEWSNVAFKESKSGFNIGLMGTYRFSNRLSLTTGVVYTKKTYSADSQYYNKKFAWLSYYDRFYGADGSCSMFEIPVQVRYDLITGNQRAFIAGGFSSYLMTKEKFDYHVNQNGDYRQIDWKNPNPGNYFFSVLQLSAGYERRLGDHLSLQLEPYAKLPLRHIGYGQLRLNSVGMNAGVKYNFGRSVR